MKLLEIRNLKKSYKSNKTNIEVLNDINLSFEKGEFVSVLGKSGCGKSTLMNIIAGMDRVYEGDILINQTELRKMKEKDLVNYRKNKIGFIFQTFNLIPHLSILDNVTLPMETSHMSKKERREKATKLLTEVGLESHLHKKPNQLSGGQKQRVAIARALANDADIILADEPTGALDETTTVQILELLNKIAKSGKLIIAVTHSKEVAEFGTRIVSLGEGKVLSDVKIKDNLFSDNEDKIEEKPKKNKKLNIFSCGKLALRNMRLKLGRNFLISWGCSIGICSLILMLSIGTGIKGYIMDEITGTSNPKVIEISKPRESEDISPIPNVMPMSDEELKEIESIENVEKVVPVVIKKMNIMLENLDNNKKTNLLVLSTISNTVSENNITNGKAPKENEVMISNMAVKPLFDTDDYDSIIGKKVKLSIPEQKGKDAILIEKELTISGVYNIDSSLMPFSAGFIDYYVLSDLYKENNLSLKPSQVDVHVTSEDKVNEVKEKLTDMGYDNSQIAQMLSMLTDMLDLITITFVGISSISLIVSGVMILVVLSITVTERTREIGVLSAIGLRKRDIKRIFLVESAFIGIASGILGCISAIIFANLGNSALLELIGTPIININYTYLLSGIIISVLISIVSGLIPANKASKLDPVESLRYE